MDKASTLQDTIQDRGRKVFIVQHLSPFAERLISGKDHRSFSQMAIIDDVKQDVGSILSIGQIADFIDDQDMRMGVGKKRLLQMSFLTGIG